MRSCIKGVLFDLDGVVVFTDKYHYLGWKRLADEKGWIFDEEVNHGCRGVPRLADIKNEYYKELLKQISRNDLYPGVIGFIEKLKAARLKLAICSSSRNAQTVLEGLQLNAYFDAVVDGNDIRSPKPDPEIFLTGASRLGLSPAECIVFEDAESGVAAAHAAGMPCVGVGGNDRLRDAEHQLIKYEDFNVSLLVKNEPSL